MLSRCAAQELYKCLVSGGRLAERLHEAVRDWLGASRPAAHLSPPSPSSGGPLPYQRLAQRVLLLLPDDGLLDFAVRLLPRPSSGGRGPAGSEALAQPARDPPRLSVDARPGKVLHWGIRIPPIWPCAAARCKLTVKTTVQRLHPPCICIS